MTVRPPKLRLRSYISHPAFGASGWICALLATITSIYFYTNPRRAPKLAYYIKPVRTIVVRAERPSDLRAFSDNIEIKTAITAAEIVIWNQGKKPIYGSEVLTPITIHTNKYVPILDAQVKASREAARIELTHTKSSTGQVTLGWKILEPGDGALIWIVYASGPEEKITINGSLEGQPELNRLEPPEGTIYRRGFDSSSERTFRWLLAFFCVFVGLCIPLFIWISASDGTPKYVTIPLTIVLLLCLIVMVHGLIYDYVEPPVGF